MTRVRKLHRQLHRTLRNLGSRDDARTQQLRVMGGTAVMTAEAYGLARATHVTDVMDAARLVIEDANRRLSEWTEDPDPAFVFLGDLSGWQLDQYDYDVLRLQHRCGYVLDLGETYAANVVCRIVLDGQHNCNDHIRGLDLG